MGHDFDVGVVGGGLIGSAAARHLAEAGHRVVVFAPQEPDDWSRGVGPFASHYDSSRITRIMAGDPLWAEIAARSTRRYADIASRSGIAFHDPRGLAWMGFDLAGPVADAVARGGDAEVVSPDLLFDRAGVQMPPIDGMECAWEGPPAGVVNPRRLAAAQLRLAELSGATLIPHAASGLRPTPEGVEINGAFGTAGASRVLVAAGAYSESLVGIDLQLDRQLRTTVRIDLGPAPEMPSIISEQVEHPYIRDMYSNPPVRYPDGRVLFKIGCEIVDPPRADSIDDITAWFRSDGDPEEAAALLATTSALLPNAEIRSHEPVPCIITRTPTGYPKIGWVDDKVAIAAGGNGSSAKSSDELGRLASTLFSAQGWSDDQLSPAIFDI